MLYNTEYFQKSFPFANLWSYFCLYYSFIKILFLITSWHGLEHV